MLKLYVRGALKRNSASPGSEKTVSLPPVRACPWLLVSHARPSEGESHLIGSVGRDQGIKEERDVLRANLRRQG